MLEISKTEGINLLLLFSIQNHFPYWLYVSSSSSQVLVSFAGQEETTNDCLHSLMATYLYRKMVADFMKDGVNFRDHLYVPERDPRTNEFFHEHEDHNHAQKRKLIVQGLVMCLMLM